MMEPTIKTANCEIYNGSALQVLKELPGQSVNCCITSPPYFCLRDYGMDGQIGLEETPQEFVAALLAVFQEVKRVLRDDGTCWINLGDSYVSSAKGNPIASSTLQGGLSNQVEAGKRPNKLGFGLPPKNLIGIPWRVAFALQDDGWYLRQDIIWSKPNPMPESVTDRCTKSHEYIFMLSKSQKYFYDQDAIKEESNYCEDRERDNTGNKMVTTPGQTPHTGFTTYNYPLRNKRDVWSVATQPFKGAHFAVFPEKLIEPCVLAGCPRGGTILDPFGGSGTTGVVANRHGRNAILIELNPKYAAMADQRLRKVQINLDFSEVLR